MQKIIPVWQPVGYSTHIIAKKVSDKFGVKTSHTGTLDPMAEGVIVVLLGETRLKKKDYARWPKEYIFQITYGISTDTYDSFGLILEVSFNFFEDFNTEDFKEKVKTVLRNFKGEYIQKVPPYSAIKVRGKPLHWYARNKKLDTIEIPQRSGQIFDISLENFRSVSSEELIQKQIEKISKVTGDLRQDVISTQWEKYLKKGNLPDEVFVTQIRTKTSKGLYIRSLSQDICKKLSVIGFIISLIRTKNGMFTEENSYSLEELFGADFENGYDFASRKGL